MPKSGALLSVCFVAGLLGALFSVLFYWGCSQWGVFSFLSVNMAQTLQQTTVHPKLLIGGLWGLGYFLTIGTPRQRRRWVRKALWFSLIPTAFALFYYQPYVLNQGLAALNLGLFAPAIILIGNLVWGLVTGFFTRLLWGR
jgi:hypothetical protein